MNNFSILFSGNSGDGIQRLGKEFILNCFNSNYYLKSSSDFPAEINSYNDTIESLSSFYVMVGDTKEVYLHHKYDVLVVFNISALKENITKLKNGGIIMAYNFLFNYLKQNKLLKNIKLIKIIKKLTINKDIRNSFILGFLSYLLKFKQNKLKQNKLYQTNNFVFNLGYKVGKQQNISNKNINQNYYENYYDTINQNYYENYYDTILNGNQSIVFGLFQVSQRSNLPIFYSYYPITPATSIINYINKYIEYSKNCIKTFLSEDEISSISSCIGASYAGYLGITATSGPGFSLMLEGIGLCFMLELPLLIINVQRAGPSTGLPTQTEQSDLFQSLYGCHGETNIPVLAAKSVYNCFKIAFIACKIAIEYMTPVVLLSDFYLANSFEVCNMQNIKEKINCNYPKNMKQKYSPYERNKNKVRFWGIPGKIKYPYRIGGLEKKNVVGDVSFDSKNHEIMVKLRKKKINKIRNYLPKQKINLGKSKGKILILSWGSTYKIINTAVKYLITEGYTVSNSHFEFINPLPKGIKRFVYNFDKVVIAELNTGQFYKIIKSKFLINAISINKIKGSQFSLFEIIKKIKFLLLFNK
ncbi:2-oxoacid:acceptor oxidoreductase family protein [Candidatus Karelsulcia muelleri]